MTESGSSPDVGDAQVPHDAIIAGAGISGLVSAAILVAQGYKKILIVDEYAHVGGNHIDRTIGGCTFDVGSLIFQDDSPLLRHFPELLPFYVKIDPRIGRINPQGLVVQYPLSVRDEIFRAGPVEWVRMISAVMIARMFRRQICNARDYAEFWIGRRLFRRSGLELYIERFYGVRPERIDPHFADKRMGWIRENASIRKRIRRWLQPSDRPPANQQLARPREGFGHLYKAATDRLEREGVSFHLGERMESIQKADETFVLQTGGGRFAARRLISTIPLNQMLKLCGLPCRGELPTVTMLSLFFSFAGERRFPFSVLYNFSHRGAWKRLTMHSDFYGASGGREFFSVEVNAGHVGESVDAAEEDFRQHVAANNLFVGDLRLEGSHILSNAYPVYVDEVSAHVAETIGALKAFGVESFGRQGGFDYQPTARVSTLVAEAALAANEKDEGSTPGRAL